MIPHLPSRPFRLSTHPSLSHSHTSPSTSSLPPLSILSQLKPLLPISPFPPIHFSAASSTPQRLLKELAERKRALSPPKSPLPRNSSSNPLSTMPGSSKGSSIAPNYPSNPSPLLNSCLPSTKLNNADMIWIEEYLLEAKQALGYPLEPSEGLPDGNPGKHFDVLLYLAFQHPFGEGTKAQARHVRYGHSRLWFLGQYVLELAFAEYFLQRYPRESPGPMRERVYAFLGKRYLPRWIKAASLQNLVFLSGSDMRMIWTERESPVKADSLAGRMLLSTRQYYVSIPFCIVLYSIGPPQDALFAHPRLFRACVPPGMHRFHGNIWDYDKKPIVMQTFGYPLPVNDRIPAMTQARNIEIGLGLQLSFLHTSKFKFEHPRFCMERLEYVGQKIHVVLFLPPFSLEGVKY